MVHVVCMNYNDEFYRKSNKLKAAQRINVNTECSNTWHLALMAQTYAPTSHNQTFIYLVCALSHSYSFFFSFVDLAVVFILDGANSSARQRIYNEYVRQM